MLRARDNPFRVERVLTVRYEPQDTTWAALLSRLELLDYRAAVCGPEGTGKTTLLEDLAARLNAAGRPTRWLQLQRELRPSARELVRDFLERAELDEILLVDGAEQIGPLTWRSLRRRARRHRGLIITTHRAGRLPTLIDCRTSAALLESIVARLVPNDIDELRSELPGMLARCNGNIRLCLRSLYDNYGENRTASEHSRA